MGDWKAHSQSGWSETYCTPVFRTIIKSVGSGGVIVKIHGRGLIRSPLQTTYLTTRKEGETRGESGSS